MRFSRRKFIASSLPLAAVPTAMALPSVSSLLAAVRDGEENPAAKSRR